MKEEIAKALDEKDLALDARDSGNTTEALRLIDRAISCLKGLWEQKGEAIDSAGANASPEERDLVEALAETYGVKGGILRSSQDPVNAYHAYDDGLRFEQHEARKVDNSYNLVQSLINRVLAEPSKTGALAPEWKVDSKDMWQELEEARGALQQQLATGRGNDPWAWADMITVQVLLASKDPSIGRQRVENAYSQFENLRPKPRVYESTLRALEDLKRCLEQVAEDERHENLNFTVGQLDLITGQLKAGFEEAKTR